MFNVIETDLGRIFICTDEKLDETERSLKSSGETFEVYKADDIEIRTDTSVKIYGNIPCLT